MIIPEAKLAFFDLDETISDRDTDMLWALWRLRKHPPMGLVEALYLLYLNRKYKSGTLTGAGYMRYQKLRVLGLGPQRYDALAREFFEQCGRFHIYSEAAGIIDHYKSRGVPVIMLTAQNRVIASCFAGHLGMTEVQGNSFTVRKNRFRKAVLPYCFREGKIGRARECAARLGARLEECAFFSDSRNDVPLLELVGHAVAVNPDPNLEERARQSGWGIMRFSGLMVTRQ